MTTTLDTQDPVALAAHARSILSCPTSVSMLVDSIELLLEDNVSLQDEDGAPLFFAPSDSPLDNAARDGRNALLRVTGPFEDAQERPAESLVLAGKLHARGECVHEDVVQVIGFEVRLVSLVQPALDARPETHVAVPLTEFRHPAHRLNRGYLLNCARHANECHQVELIRATSRATGVDMGSLAGVSLVDLDPTGVDLHWIDGRGAHVLPLRFHRPARTPEELAAMLSAELHDDLC